MKPIALLSLLSVVFAASCNRSSTLRYDDPSAEETVSVAYLKTLLRGESTSIARTISVRVRVTANDLFGEYADAIVAQDASAGIEVWIEAATPRLAAAFPIGTPLLIRCNGLALGNYAGKTVLGLPPTGGDPVDRIPLEQAGQFVRTAEPGQAALPEPVPIGFEEFSPQRIGTYVRLDEVRFAAEEIGRCFCERDPDTGRYLSTNRHLVDACLDTLRVRILAGCEYRMQPVPSGTGSVCGILDFFNREYQLRIVNRQLSFEEAIAFGAPPRAYPSASGR